MLYNTQIQHPNKSSTSYIGTTASINYHTTYVFLDMTSCMEDVLSLLINIIFFNLHSKHTPYNQGLPLNQVCNLNITTILRRWHLIIIRSITSKKRGNALCCLIRGDEGEDGVAERDLWFCKGRGVVSLYGKGKGRLAAGL